MPSAFCAAHRYSLPDALTTSASLVESAWLIIQQLQTRLCSLHAIMLACNTCTHAYSPNLRPEF